MWWQSSTQVSLQNLSKEVKKRWAAEINGRDDDDNTGLFDGRLGANVREPNTKARDGGTGEFNVAAKDFDLTGFEVGASIPFKIISLPAFGEHQEGDLMFEVWGRIEILAPR